MTKQKKWFWMTIAGTGIGLFCILVVMVIFDPYFHYHGKLPGLKYRIYNERYINPGILEHFDYDAIIAGTSMNQNFKTSQLDRLWGTKAVKVPFSGAGFKEIRENLERAFESHNQIKYVLWGIDYNGLLRDSDYVAYEEYPEYLYDKNIFNDVFYVWNKDILTSALLNNMLMTLKGEETTSFDEYASWDVGRGWDFIKLSYYQSLDVLPMETGITEQERKIIEENLENNIISLVKANPDTEFVLFYTPYSILYWNKLYIDGTLEKQFLVEKIATEMLLEYDNITLYNFFHKTDMVCNLDNYRDELHYVNDINDKIIDWITVGEGKVTKENYLQRIEEEQEFYFNFDYSLLFPYYNENKEVILSYANKR